MQAPLPVAVTAELRRSVGALIERLGETDATVADDWSRFARSCGVTSGDTEQHRGDALLIVGDVEYVLNRVQRHDQEFGFITPSRKTLRPWQSGERWNLDPTIRLWRLGWSPVAVERIMLATDDGVMELAVGNARRTPVVSALVDGD